MKSLPEQVADSLGGRFVLAYPIPPEGEPPQTETAADDNLAIVGFDPGHGLRFLLRSAFSSDPFPPRESDGWGYFANETGRPSVMSALLFISISERTDERADGSDQDGAAESTAGGAKAPAAAATGTEGYTGEHVDTAAEAEPGEAQAEAGAESEPSAQEDEEGEGELVPAYAYAAIERARSGFNVVGFAVILGKAPEGNFVAEEGETFDASSALWLRVASNDYTLNTEGSPLDQLVRTTVEGLDEPLIYALVPDHYHPTLAGFDAKIVATVEVDDGDGVFSVLQVTLKQESAAEEPAGGGAAAVDEAVVEEPAGDAAAVVEEPAGGAAAVVEESGEGGEPRAEGPGVVKGEGGVQHVADDTITTEHAKVTE